MEPARPPAPVVVPNGTLFGDGVCARIKEELLKEFNLHTIVRLPKRHICAVHEHPDEYPLLRPLRPDEDDLVLRRPAARRPEELHEDQPIQFEDMAACKAWFTANKRVENEQAWKIDFKTLIEEAVAEATPHWDAAREANTRAHKLERQAKETKDELRGNSKDAAQKAKLQAQLDELDAAATNERKIQMTEQNAADAIYWPLFNLDPRTRPVPTPWNTAHRVNSSPASLPKSARSFDSLQRFKPRWRR